MGVDIEGEWVSLNTLLDWYAMGGDLPWLPLQTLIDQASEQYQRMKKKQETNADGQADADGKVRRWGQWRPGLDRWHNKDGSKKVNMIVGDTTAAVASSSSSSSVNIPPASSSTSSGLLPGTSSMASSSSTPSGPIPGINSSGFLVGHTIEAGRYNGVGIFVKYPLGIENRIL